MQKLKVVLLQPSKSRGKEIYMENQQQDNNQNLNDSTVQSYTCPMHPEIVQNTPGNCSKCGMNLIKAKKDQSGKEQPKSNMAMAADEEPASYLPLVLVIGFILIVIGAWEFYQGRFELRESMRLFMGLFFLIFGSFKAMSWKGFAYAFAEYDIVAKKFIAYAFAYPAIELVLGLLFIFNIFPTFANITTVVIMGVGSIGVIKAVTGKRKIRCACLGVVVKLPMTTVTIIEDVGMGLMALAMLTFI